MKIAVLSSHTPSLFWFRIDMMKSFLASGCEVVAFGDEPVEVWGEKIAEKNIKYRQIKVERNSTNFLKDIKTFISIIKALKEEKPDKIFCYQAKTVVYGSIAARMVGIKNVYSLIAGLGSVFLGGGLKSRLVCAILSLEYKVAFKCCKKVFFQNHDDSSAFINRKIVSEDKIVYINGSGVNTEEFVPSEIPEVPAFLYIGRLIKDKGIVEYLEACRKVKDECPHIRCMLVGPFDTNPSALKPEELQTYIDDGIIEYFGQQSNVKDYIKQCWVYVLPSYHEGTPKTVLESMACGRAIITTDAPGCRETVEDGVNGYLVPVKDVNSLAEKMKVLIQDKELVRKMGTISRDIAVDKFDVNIVNGKIKETMNI